MSGPDCSTSFQALHSETVAPKLRLAVFFLSLTFFFTPFFTNLSHAAGAVSIVETGNTPAVVPLNTDQITAAPGVSGIYAKSQQGGSFVSTGSGSSILASGNISGIRAESDGGSSVVDSQSIISVDGAGSQIRGVFAAVTNALADSGIKITHSLGAINVSGDLTSDNSAAISARMQGGATEGISIDASNAKFATDGYNTHGIYAEAAMTSGDINISASNVDMDLRGKNSDGIYVRTIVPNSTSNVNITTNGGTIVTTNTGAVLPDSQTSHGIVIVHERADASGDSTIKNNGTAITTKTDVAGFGTSSRPLLIVYQQSSATGNALIENSGTLTTQAEGSQGILIRNLGSGSNTIFNQGAVTTQGKSAHALAIDSTSGTGAGRVQNSATLQSTGEDASGIFVRSNNAADKSLDVSNNNQILAGWGQAAGIFVQGLDGRQSIINSGEVGALSDRALQATANSGASVTVENTGTFTGFVTFGDEDATFSNNSFNSLNLRNFSDTNGDGVRDAKAVAISDFGGGNDVFVNNGAVRLLPVSGESSVNAADQYIPLGALDIRNPGTVHAQFRNLERFENAGLIDLTLNRQPGDVLVITGKAIAGENPGTGTYVSSGGSLRLDSVINKGGHNGVGTVSDMLVVDNVAMGSGPTKIYVTPQKGSPGGLTTGDGIKLVEVNGNQAPDSFTLGSPVSYGAYEYVLGRGLSADSSNNWFLRNIGYTNPNVGGYIANQHLAADMFTQNILDRRDSVRVPDSTIWMRLNHSYSEGRVVKVIDTEMRSTLLQIGADLYKNDSEELIAGVYTGLGIGDTKNKSKYTGSKTDGDVKGYHVGAYGSWLPKGDAKGLFVDVWGYYAWFDNELSGAGMQNKTTRYDSSSYALSAELGYGIPFYSLDSGSRWILEPHAQAIYNRLTVDDFTDKLDSKYSKGNAEGVRTRLGGRVYMEKPEGSVGVKALSPFVEANWLHNGVEAKGKFGTDTLTSKYGKDVGEVKVGVQGQLTQQLGLWTHLGYQEGTPHYKRTEVQLGFSWTW